MAAPVFLSFFGKQGLAGGLNLADNPIIVAPNEMVDASNVDVTSTLARKKRGALDRYSLTYPLPSPYPVVANPSTVASAIRGVIQYWTTDAATGTRIENVFLHQGTKVWQVPDRTSAAVDRTGALVLNQTGIPCYEVFEGILYFLSSTTSDGYNKWDATLTVPGPAVSATAPVDGAGTILRAHQGRMFMAGNPDFPFRLYYSAPLDAEDWVSADAGSFDITYDNDPSGITAIFPPFQGRLYFATRRRIYELTGTTPDDFVIRPVTQGVGCVSHHSVAATPNDIYFCSDRGVHSLQRLQVSDQAETTFASRTIQPLYVDLLNRNLLNRIQGVFDEVTNSYIISAVSGGQLKNDTTLAYNIEFGTWRQWKNIDARSVSTVLIDGQQFILMGRENGEIAFINKNKTKDFDTTGIGFTFKTGKVFPNDEIEKQWRFHSITIYASATRPSQVQISWEIDGLDTTITGQKQITIGSEASVLGSTFVLGQSTLGYGRFLAKRVTTDDTGYSLQLRITVGGDGDIEFYGFRLEVSPADDHFN